MRLEILHLLYRVPQDIQRSEEPRGNHHRPPLDFNNLLRARVFRVTTVIAMASLVRQYEVWKLALGKHRLLHRVALSVSRLAASRMVSEKRNHPSAFVLTAIDRSQRVFLCDSQIHRYIQLYAAYSRHRLYSIRRFPERRSVDVRITKRSAYGERRDFHVPTIQHAFTFRRSNWR